MVEKTLIWLEFRKGNFLKVFDRIVAAIKKDLGIDFEFDEYDRKQIKKLLERLQRRKDRGSSLRGLESQETFYHGIQDYALQIWAYMPRDHGFGFSFEDCGLNDRFPQKKLERFFKKVNKFRPHKARIRERMKFPGNDRVLGIAVITNTSCTGRGVPYYCFDYKFRWVNLKRLALHVTYMIIENKLVLIDIKKNAIIYNYDEDEIRILADKGYLDDLQKINKEKNKIKKKRFGSSKELMARSAKAKIDLNKIIKG